MKITLELDEDTLLDYAGKDHLESNDLSELELALSEELTDKIFFAPIQVTVHLEELSHEH